MKKFGYALIFLNIVVTATIIAIGFKRENLLFPLIIGLASISGIVLLGNIFKIAKSIAKALKESKGAWATIKNLIFSFYNTLDIFAVIGQTVLYMLLVSNSPGLFITDEVPTHFKTKNLITIVSLCIQITLTILKKFVGLDIFTEIIIMIGLITAFLIYDIKVDIDKKKVDKYSYK